MVYYKSWGMSGIVDEFLVFRFMFYSGRKKKKEKEKCKINNY